MEQDSSIGENPRIYLYKESTKSYNRQKSSNPHMTMSQKFNISYFNLSLLTLRYKIVCPGSCTVYIVQGMAYGKEANKIGV